MEYFSISRFLFTLMFMKHPSIQCHRAYKKNYPASYEQRYFDADIYASMRSNNKRMVVEHALIHGNCVVIVKPDSDTVELILDAK